MFGTVFALLLIAMPALAVWALLRSGSVPRDDLWLRIWTTAWFPVVWLFLWAPDLFTYANPEWGYSYWVFWVPLGSWMAVSLGCKTDATKCGALTGILLSAAVMVGMGVWHSDAWSFRSRDRSNWLAVVIVRSSLKNAPLVFADRTLPPGWIENLPPNLLQDGAKQLRALGITEQRSHFAEWHTWLTGLYRVDSSRAGIWYPGGKPSEVAKAVQWKPR